VETSGRFPFPWKTAPGSLPRGYRARVDAEQQAGVLVELRDVAATLREARRRIADLTAEQGRQSPGHAAAWTAYRAVNDRWSALIRRAAGEGHTLADVARAAGCAGPSLYRHLDA
jgi:hypothetical protein